MDLGYRKNTASQGWATMRQYQAWHPLHLMAANIGVPSVVLDYPTMDDFRHELGQGYDAVCISFGASSAVPALGMVREARRATSRPRIVVGGYGTDLLDASDDPIVREIREGVDEICRGEGVSFMREFAKRRFGIGSGNQIVQNLPLQRFGFEAVPGRISRGLVLVAALGCRNRCEFCSTSHHFRGEKIVLLGPDAFREELARSMDLHRDISDVLVYDEDLLADRERALEMARSLEVDPSISRRDLRLTIFASARSLERYTVRELVDLRVGTIFVGVESIDALAAVDGCSRAKRGTGNPADLFRRLNEAGIHNIGSLIGGWEGQTPQDLDRDARGFATLNPTFYQVLPLTALPGTPLWDNHKDDGMFDSENVWRRPEVWGSRFGEWIGRANRMLVEEGGPWFFRMAENHLQAVRSPISERHRLENANRLADLEPLALASGIFFRGDGFRLRWRRFVASRMQANPAKTLLLLVAGVAASLLLCCVHHIGRLMGATGAPRFSRTAYPGDGGFRCA
jgi:hypothetical protein